MKFNYECNHSYILYEWTKITDTCLQQIQEPKSTAYTIGFHFNYSHFTCSIYKSDPKYTLESTETHYCNSDYACSIRYCSYFCHF